jgi:hypothetical protein
MQAVLKRSIVDMTYLRPQFASPRGDGLNRSAVADIPTMFYPPNTNL